MERKFDPGEVAALIDLAREIISQWGPAVGFVSAIAGGKWAIRKIAEWYGEADKTRQTLRNRIAQLEDQRDSARLLASDADDPETRREWQQTVDACSEQILELQDQLREIDDYYRTLTTLDDKHHAQLAAKKYGGAYALYR